MSLRPAPTSAHLAIAAAVALIAAPVANAATFTVGTSGCSHPSIQAALAAAEGSPGADVIRLSRMLDYTEQAISFATGQELDIEGGYENCGSAKLGFTILDGQGGSASPVMNVSLGSGAILRLRNLLIRRGDATGDGGGLAVRGNGLVEIYDSSFTNNTARLGGGIYADDATLVIGAGTLIASNIARHNGGGIYANDAALRISEPRTYIFNNEALGQEDSDGLGGGVLVRACDRNLTPAISSPGLNGAGVISGNRAVRGGGIAAVVGADCDFDIRLNIYALAGQAPPVIFDNLATVSGGAIYARSNVEFLSTQGMSNIWIKNATLEGNVSPRGAAVQLASDSTLNGDEGSSLFINKGSFGADPADAAPCPAGVPCALIIGNENKDANNVPRDGYTIESDEDVFKFVAIANTLFQGNRGTGLVRTAHAFTFENSAAVGNVLTNAAFIITEASNGADVAVVRDATIAGNGIGGTASIRTGNREVTIERSIIWEPGRLTIARTSGSMVAQSVIANETATLAGPNTGRTFEEPPRFVDPANGDYTLRAASAAVDFVETVPGSTRDVSQLPRNVDIPIVPDRFGPRDLGAYERGTLLPIVLNGDIFPIAGQPNQWTLLSPQASYSSENAPNSPAGSGSISLTAAPGGSSVSVPVAQQCVEIPGPAIYGLNGSGRSSGATSMSRDGTFIRWQLHTASDACTGGIAAQGVLALGAPNGWARPANGAAITVTPAQWSRSTSVLLTLVVQDNSIVGGSTANGGFDRITLEPGVDPIFSNSFE